MFAIATGNVANGFQFIGPFATEEEANEYGDKMQVGNDGWWVVPMEAPAAVEPPPTKSIYMVVVDHLLEHGYYPCSTMEEVEQVKQNYMSSETEVYRCELIETNGLFLG